MAHIAYVRVTNTGIKVGISKLFTKEREAIDCPTEFSLANLTEALSWIRDNVPPDSYVSNIFLSDSRSQGVRTSPNRP